MSTFILENADVYQVPCIISIPHMGTEVPESIASQMNQDSLTEMKDTDWIVDQLYPFAKDLGVPVIKSVYSRYVIDLNRPKDAKPLYSDGRQETTLCPTHDFDGKPLYNDTFRLTEEEQNRRIETFYTPYHTQLEKLLMGGLEKFGKVLLVEAHSIRRSVPKLHPSPFPDLILGNQQGRTCSEAVIEAAFQSLKNHDFNVKKNDPFMGGFITRNYADSKKRIQTIQLEKSQDLYFDEASRQLNENSPKLVSALREMVESMIKEIEND